MQTGRRSMAACFFADTRLPKHSVGVQINFAAPFLKMFAGIICQTKRPESSTKLYGY
jgi:hypothetical protein